MLFIPDETLARLRAARATSVAAQRALKILQRVKLRPTRQRLALAGVLFLEQHRHVTAEDLHREAANAGVPLSLATVYNTLNQFTDAGLVRKVSVSGARAYFDTDAGEHHHFYVEAEDRIIDIPPGEIRFDRLPIPPDGYEIAKIDVVIRWSRSRLEARRAPSIHQANGPAATVAASPILSSKASLEQNRSSKSMLTIGAKFPSFDLQAVVSTDPAEAFTRITNESDAGKWKVIFFWPKDFTFVCPTEIAAFSKLNGEFTDREAVVYGASTDNEFVHLAWRQNHADLKDLPFPMLSDIKRELSAALGVLHPQEGVCLRATFIVDPQGIIRFVSVNDLNVGRNPSEVLRILDALQTDELCGCNWQKGDDVLKAA